MRGAVGHHARRGWSYLPVRVAALVGFVALNAFIYSLPIDYRVFGAYQYPGVFLLTFIANAAVVLPVPYIPVLLHVAATAEHAWLVVLAASLGSVLGESVAFFVGRAGSPLVQQHRLYSRLKYALGTHPLQAGLFLFVFAAPLNPIFDVAGVSAGALGVSYRVFFIAVFLARCVRTGIIAWIGIGLAGV